MYLGIDLGTTNTVVSRSFVDSTGKLVTEVVKIGQLYNDNWEKFETLPSAVFFDEDGVVGDTKGGFIVGREAKRQREQDKNNVVLNAKRFMGTSHFWTINKMKYEAKDIAAMVLQHCKKVIDREANMNYNTVVITVPASFNPEQIADTLRGAKQAGFKDDQVIIKHEPTAALLSFLDTEVKKNARDRFVDFSTKKRMMVFDLGGGTCDTSIIDVKVSNNEIQFTEIAIGRYQELGGLDFDAKLTYGLLNKYFKDNNIVDGTLTDKEKEVMYDKLMLASEKIKEKLSATIYGKLSSGSDVNIEEIQVKHNIPDFYNGKPYRIAITKAEYDKYTESLYIDENINYKKFEDMDKHKNIIGVIRKTLEDYKIPKNSIDFIFMTGGMSQFITVKEKIRDYMNKPIIAPEDPMYAVARGASIYQYYKVTEKKADKDYLLENTDNNSSENSDNLEVDPKKGKEVIVDKMMLAEAVLLDMNEGLPKVIIPKKTVVPNEGEVLNRFRTSSPSGVKLNIYAGEDEMDSSMRIQKSIEKSFTFPVESGTPFDIKYKINENKAIEMQIIIHDLHHQNLEISIHNDLRISEQNYNIFVEEV